MINRTLEYFYACLKQGKYENKVEEGTNYQLEEPNNMHDKLFRGLLKDETEFAKFIGAYLNLSIKEKLEKYNSSFITEIYENKEADIVYKLKGKNVFILLEHQSTVDKKMPFRILNYNVEIIKDNVPKGKKEEYYMQPKYAKIIPIVLYTGSSKWTVAKNFSEIQETYGKEEYLEVKYNIIDINQYDKKQLLKGKTTIEKAMAIEKSKTQEELIQTIEQIVDSIDFKNTKEVEKIKQIIRYAISSKIGEEKAKELIEKINEKNKKEGTSMLYDNLRAEEREWEKQGKQIGIKETIIKTIRNMIEIGLNEEIIKKVTGASHEEIEEIQKTM